MLTACFTYDTTIAAIIRAMGWCGMLASTAWLAASGLAQLRRDE